MAADVERCPLCRARRVSDTTFECSTVEDVVFKDRRRQSDTCRRLVKLANREAIIAVGAREYFTVSQMMMERYAKRESVNDLVQRAANAEHVLEMALTKRRYIRQEFGDEVADAMQERAEENIDDGA